MQAFSDGNNSSDNLVTFEESQSQYVDGSQPKENFAPLPVLEAVGSATWVAGSTSMSRFPRALMDLMYYG